MSARSVRSALVGAVLCCWLQGITAHAAPEHPLVRAGMAAYESLQYTRAVSLLERARRASLSPEERAVALTILGSAKVVLGDERGARAVFSELLELQPDSSLDAAVSPRIRMVFEEIRAQVLATRPPDPPLDKPVPQLPSPQPTPPPAPVLAPAGPAIPVPLPRPVQPIQIAAPRPAPVPVYRRGWFWGVVGGVAGAAVVGGVLGGILGRHSDGQLIVVPH